MTNWAPPQPRQGYHQAPPRTDPVLIALLVVSSVNLLLLLYIADFVHQIASALSVL